MEYPSAAVAPNRLAQRDHRGPRTEPGSSCQRIRLPAPPVASHRLALLSRSPAHPAENDIFSRARPTDFRAWRTPAALRSHYTDEVTQYRRTHDAVPGLVHRRCDCFDRPSGCCPNAKRSVPVQPTVEFRPDVRGASPSAGVVRSLELRLRYDQGNFIGATPGVNKPARKLAAHFEKDLTPLTWGAGAGTLVRL